MRLVVRNAARFTPYKTELKGIYEHANRKNGNVSDSFGFPALALKEITMQFRLGFLSMLTIFALSGTNFPVYAAVTSQHAATETQNAQTIALQKDIATSIKEKNGMTYDELKERGKELRADVEITYKTLRENKALQGGFKGNDVSQLVGKYIPSGMSFDDAETILLEAGCEVSSRFKGSPISSDVGRYVVFGEIKLLQKFPTLIELSISLIPEAPGNYSVVRKTSATIIITTP